MKYVEIKLTKCRLFLTEAEIYKLLRSDPLLWREAIGRGKAFMRARRQRERENG